MHTNKIIIMLCFGMAFVAIVGLSTELASRGIKLMEAQVELDKMEASRNDWKDLAIESQDTIAELRAKQATKQIFEGVNNEGIRKIEGTLIVFTTTGEMLVVDLLYDPSKPGNTLELH